MNDVFSGIIPTEFFQMKSIDFIYLLMIIILCLDNNFNARGGILNYNPVKLAKRNQKKPQMVKHLIVLLFLDPIARPFKFLKHRFLGIPPSRILSDDGHIESGHILI